MAPIKTTEKVFFLFRVPFLACDVVSRLKLGKQVDNDFNAFCNTELSIDSTYLPSPEFCQIAAYNLFPNGIDWEISQLFGNEAKGQSLRLELNCAQTSHRSLFRPP